MNRPASEILDNLTEARTRTDELFGTKAVPIYVPPWNRLAPELEHLLPKAGFRGISARGRASGAREGLRRINIHLDIIDWRGSRGGADPDQLAAELADHLAWSRQTGQPAIGVVTHHLNHDHIAWQFLSELFEETAGHPAVHWVRASTLLEG